MIGIRSAVLAALTLGVPAGPVFAQIEPASAKTVAEQKQWRYQIGQMERMLEGAVEHGAAVTRDRLLAVLPANVLLTESALVDSARARGFRLDGYGVFFDVEVPTILQTALAWSLRTLDQNDLGLDHALKALKTHIQAAGDPELEQALERVELQVGPAGAPVGRLASMSSPAKRNATTSIPPANGPQAPPADPILDDPQEAYHTEVRQAIMDAMLDHSASLAVGSGEWLTIAAKRRDDRPLLAPLDGDARTLLIRVRGADLASYQERKISREEAFSRMEVRWLF